MVEGASAYATSFDVVLDTCVLLPITLCDTLLRFADAGFYRPHWSGETLNELERNLIPRLGLPEEKARRRVEQMTSAFPDGEVLGYAPLISSMPIPDPKDRHVVAAAVRSNSQVIVTANLRDFPDIAIRDFDIQVQSPDLFLIHQCNLDIDSAASLIRRQAAEKRMPPVTPSAVLDRLATNAPTFANAMRLVFGFPTLAEVVLPPSADALIRRLEDVRKAS